MSTVVDEAQLMFSDVVTLFYNHVLKSYQDYVAINNNGIIGHSQDVRAAIEAATALYHFREHLPESLSISFNKIVRQCSDYKLIRDVANASKHGSIERNAPLISKPTALEEFVFLTEYRDELGPYVHAEKTIMVKLDNGSSQNLSDALRNVVNFWIDYVQSHGLLTQIKTFKPPSEGAVLRKNSRRLDMAGTQGIMMDQKSFVIFRYDYEKKMAVPVDLTNAQVELTFYKPTPLVLDLKIRTKGRTFTSSLNLDEANTLKIESLNSDEERNLFVRSLPGFQEMFKELCLQAKAWQDQVDNGTADLDFLDEHQEQAALVQEELKECKSFSFGGIFNVAKLEVQQGE